MTNGICSGCGGELDDGQHFRCKPGSGAYAPPIHERKISTESPVTDGGSPRAAQDRLNTTLRDAHRLLLNLGGKDFDVLTRLIVMVKELAALSASASPRVPDPARATASQPEDGLAIHGWTDDAPPPAAPARAGRAVITEIEAHPTESAAEVLAHPPKFPDLSARAGRAGGDLERLRDKLTVTLERAEDKRLSFTANGTNASGKTYDGKQFTSDRQAEIDAQWNHWNARCIAFREALHALSDEGET